MNQSSTWKLQIVLMVLAACLLDCVLFAQEIDGTRLEFSGKTMGPIDYSVIVIVPDANQVDQDSMAQLISDALESVNQMMSTYIPSSDVSRFNNLESTDWFEVGSETAKVVARANEISVMSEGAFDITVGPAVNLWNFGPNQKRFAIPSSTEIDSLKQIVGFDKLSVRLDPPAIRKSVPGLKIDLSAIAKGYAVDKVVMDLNAAGFRRLMVSVGGEVRTMGVTEKNRPWRIGIEKPSERTIEVARKVDLSDRSVATSGDYRNFRMVDGKRYSHTIDPRTCRPVENFIAEASVIADDCMTADAAATAVMVMGVEKGALFCRENKFPLLTIERDPENPLDDKFFKTLIADGFPIASDPPSAKGESENSIVGVFVAAICIFGLAVLGMAIGAIFGNKPIQGSCGGLANMKNEDGSSACGVCEKPSSDCVENQDNADQAV